MGNRYFCPFFLFFLSLSSSPPQIKTNHNGRYSCLHLPPGYCHGPGCPSFPPCCCPQAHLHQRCFPSCSAFGRSLPVHEAPATLHSPPGQRPPGVRQRPVPPSVLL